MMNNCCRFFYDMIIKRFVEQDTINLVFLEYGPTYIQIETNIEKGSKQNINNEGKTNS